MFRLGAEIPHALSRAKCNIFGKSLKKIHLDVFELGNRENSAYKFQMVSPTHK